MGWSMVVFAPPKRLWFFNIANQYGATNENIAEAFGISIGLLNQWIKDNPGLNQAIKEGRDNWDTGKVELTLLRRVMGYEYQEERTREVQVAGVDADGVAVAHSLLPINLSKNALVSL